MRISRLRREEIHSSRRVPLCQDGGKQLHGCWRVARCFRRRTCETRRIRNSCTKQVRNTHDTVLLYSHFHTIHSFFFSFQFYQRNTRDISRRKKSGQLEFVSNRKTHLVHVFFLIFSTSLFLSGKEGKFGIHELY